MKKILIMNVDLPNKGNQALTSSTIDTIKQFIPDVEFTLMGRKGGNLKGFEVKKAIGYKPEYGETRSERIIYYSYYFVSSAYHIVICVLINIFSRLNFKFKINKKSTLFDYYSCDALIDVGGDSLSGEYGTAVISILVNFIYGILLKKPIVLYGASLGYFKSSTLNIFTKTVLNKTKLILVRENKSKTYLEDNHITKPVIYVTADPAFLIKPISASAIYKILTLENIKGLKKPLIGINISGMISGFREQSNEDLISIFTKTVDYLVDNLDMNILLIPHVFDQIFDDRCTTKEVYKNIKNKSRVNLITNEYSPQELKGLIGLCDLFVGTRMHATIASTSLMIPTVGIAYSHKMKGIIGELLGQKEYILDVNYVNYEKLISKITEAWNNREKIRNQLKTRIPEMKEKALLNGMLVKDILKD